MGSSLESRFNKSDALNVSLDESMSLGAVSSAAKSSGDSKMNTPVPHPPGRTGSNPFLKPPPGRAEPLPPEPPASLRPPPSKAGPTPPPPPPAPPAPPAPAKSSSSTGPRPPGPPPPPPIAPRVKPGPRTLPPPIGGSAPRPPPPMPSGPKVPRPPLGSKHPSNTASSEGAGMEDDADAPKAKLKPFFWDKVLANPDHSMVWHQIKSGSFQ